MVYDLGALSKKVYKKSKNVFNINGWLTEIKSIIDVKISKVLILSYT